MVLEPTIKHLTKETSLWTRAENNLVRNGQNIRAEIYLMEKCTLKAIIGRSRYNTIKNYWEKKLLNE